MLELLLAASLIAGADVAALNPISTARVPGPQVVDTVIVRDPVIVRDTVGVADAPVADDAPARDLRGNVLVAVSHTEETFTAARSSWREDIVSVRLNASGVAQGRARGSRDLRSTVIAFEAGQAERFGRHQPFGGFDFYRSIAGRTYANLRIRFAPRAIVIPEFDVLFEITADAPSGWEGSVGWRTMRYKKSAVGIYSIAGARYHGHWYLRGKASLIPVAGSAGAAALLSARRYFGGGGDLAELVASAGREVITAADGTVLDIRESVSVLVRGEYYVIGNVGVTAGAGYTRDKVLTRWGLSAGLKARI